MSEHIVPVKVYVVIFLALLVGTGLTVVAAFYNFRWQFNTVIALTIASVKATLVVLYFMHVRYSPRLVWVIVASALVDALGPEGRDVAALSALVRDLRAATAV